MPVTAQSPGLVALQDTVYTIGTGTNIGTVYKYLGSGQNWKAIGGNVKVSQVAVTRNNAYILNNQHDTRAYKDSDGTTKIVDRVPERKVLASSAKFVYKLHLNQNRIYQYSSKDWILVDDGVKATAITVDEDDTLYQLHSDGRISKYLGSEGWQEIDNTLNVQSIVAGGGKLYKLHKEGGVYVHLEDYNWDRIDKSSDAIQVAAGPAGVFKINRGNSVWQFDESAKKWDMINSSRQGGVDIAVGDTLYMLYSTGEIYKRNLTAKNFTRIK